MKVRKSIMAFAVGISLLCTAVPVEAKAVGEEGQLEPADLHFRKFYTGRNLFDSEIPIQELNIPQGEQGLAMQNTQNEVMKQTKLLGKFMPYSMYDLSVVKQDVQEQGGASAEIIWKQDDNNEITLKKASVGENEETEQDELVTYLDMQDKDLLQKYEISSEVSPACVFEKIDGAVKVSSGGDKIGEAYLHVGKVTQDSYINVTVSEQVKKSYTANALVKLRNPGTPGKNNGIFVCQRKDGTLTAEVIVEGESKKNVVISDKAEIAPYDLQVGVSGNEIQITRIKDGKVTGRGVLDVTGIYNFLDSSVLDTFEYTIGGRLAPEESVTFSKAGIYQKKTEENAEKILSSLDMNDAELLQKVSIYDDLKPYNSVEKIDGGISFSGNGDRGETYVSVGRLQQDTVLEAEITEQSVKNYTASALLKFRDKTADNTKSNGIYLTQRAAGGGNKTLSLEVIVNGKSVKNINIVNDAVSYPYKLRLALHGNVVTASRVVEGKEEHITQLDVGQWFSLEDEEVLKNFEATIGSKLGSGETVSYSSAMIKEHQKREEPEFPEKDEGFILQVKKNGNYVLNKTLYYPENMIPEEPYTVRAHWAGQFLGIWLVKDGKPYLMGTEDISPYFDMRDETVFPNFQVYMGTTLTPGAEISISSFRNYYTGGDGQADPKPLHYKDGTVMIDDGKMWLSMTLRGYQQLPASCQAIYSLDLKTYELQLVNITTFRKPGDTKHWAYHASDFCYDEDADRWIVITSSHGDDKLLRAGVLPEDPRNCPYMTVDVDTLTYEAGARSNYEDPSIIYDEEAGKWRIATCFSGNGGFNVGLIEADNFNGPYHEIAAYESGSCTGILIQKVGEEYYVFTGRSPHGNGEGAMNLEALNYPEMTKNTSLHIDGQTDSYNPWPMLFPVENEKGETVYRLLSFDRDTIIANDGSMAQGQYSYGRIYLYEALEKYNSKDKEMEIPEIQTKNTEIITTADELWAVSEKTDGNYKLGADIDLTGRQWYPIGTKENPFSGTFDGTGHSIIGLTANDTQGMNGVGLFGYTSESAEIKNLNIADGEVAGRIYTGLLTGYNQGNIFNCAVNGKVTGESETGLLVGRNRGNILQCSGSGEVNGTGNDSTGGLVGANSQGTIEACKADADVLGTVNTGGLVGYNDRGIIKNAYAKGTVKGQNYVGGFVGATGASGYEKTCQIINCYAESTVEGNTAGIFAGFNDKDIQNCFGVGQVTGEKAVGGFVGRNNQYGNVENSYTNAAISGKVYVGSLFGKNSGNYKTVACPEEMTAIGNSPDTVVSNKIPDFTDANTYLTGELAGWDESIWKTGEGLPELISVPEVPELPIPELVSLKYEAETGGRIEGETIQQVEKGKSGTEVRAVAEEGYQFEGWSDGRKEEKRADVASENLVVTAQFEKIVNTSEADTSQTESKTSGKNKAAKTADNSDIMLYFALLIFAGIVGKKAIK